MSQEFDASAYQAGGGLVAGLAENVAQRLASLEVPGRRSRASVGAEEPAGTPAGAKPKKSSRDKKTMAARKSSTRSTAKKPVAKKTPVKRAAAKKSAAKAARSNGGGKAAQKQEARSAPRVSPEASPRTGSGATGTEKDTAFTGPTPGPEQKTIANMLGEVVWLMTQSAQHKIFFVSDLEWLAMAPILLKQFRVFYATDKDAAGGEQSKPIGVVLWAAVNEEVEARLAAGNAKMRPQDWRSGDRLWVVDVIAPFGGHDAMLQDLKTQVFKDKSFKFRAVVDGQPGVREM